MHRARFSSEKDLRSLPSRFVLQPSARGWLALSCTHSDVVHARLAVNHGSRPHQDGQEGAFTAVDRALARSQPSFPSGATRGRHRTRETARRRERLRGTRRPSRGRETRERAGTWSYVIDRTGAVPLGGLARSFVPRRASLRARAMAETLGFCSCAVLFPPPDRPPHARRDMRLTFRLASS